MIEKDNMEQEARIKDVRDSEVRQMQNRHIVMFLIHKQKTMQDFCEALPEDRLLHGSDHDLDTLMQKEEGKKTYKISSTGALLTYHSAMAVLARYASSLVSDTLKKGASALIGKL